MEQRAAGARGTEPCGAIPSCPTLTTAFPTLARARGTPRLLARMLSALSLETRSNAGCRETCLGSGRNHWHVLEHCHPLNDFASFLYKHNTYNHYFSNY